MKEEETEQEADRKDQYPQTPDLTVRPEAAHPSLRHPEGLGQELRGRREGRVPES